MRGLLLSSSLLPIHGGLSKRGNYPSIFIFVPIATKILSKNVTQAGRVQPTSLQNSIRHLTVSTEELFFTFLVSTVS